MKEYKATVEVVIESENIYKAIKIAENETSHIKTRPQDDISSIDVVKIEKKVDKILNEDQSIKYDIKDHLIYHEPIEQTIFLDFIENETIYSRKEAVSYLREMMEDNEVSYTSEYKLQIE